MANVKNVAPGIGLCAAIAIPCWFLGEALPVVGGPVFAILIGMVIALFWKDQKSAKSGTTYTSKKILQLAVVLLGFGMNLSSVLQVGGQSLPIIVSTIATSLIVAFALYKALHMDSNISTLIGVGSSICGGSAIAATAPVIGADDEEIAQAISVIFLFNVIAALIFPTLGGVLGLSNEGFGLFAGTAVNDTSSVTAAAAAWDGMHPGANTLDTAAIVKMTRTLAIIPITLVLALLRTRREGKQDGTQVDIKKIFPWFVLLFLLASIITTVLPIPAAAVSFLKNASKFFIVMAMAAIGLNTDIVKLVKTGGKPIFMGFCCWVAIAGVIAMEPAVLILDEPTAGLDPQGRDSILENIRAYQKAKHATVMMVSHAMEEVARMTDRLLVMDHGGLRMDNSPREVFRHAWELQQIGLAIPQVTRVFLRLRELGVPVDSSVYTVEQAVQELLRLKGGKASC